jgi:hypothetical protein
MVGLDDKEHMSIAILGWGSLLWEGGCEFDDQHEPWQFDGPELKVEFSRVSSSRSGALTLVIDEQYGSLTTVAWCLSKRHDVEDAVCDLRCREGTTLQHIGRICLDNQHAVPASPTSASHSIGLWARGKELDAVIWTALTSNFTKKARQPAFSVEAAIAYLQTLGAAGKVRAAEYVWRAPDFVRTPLRSALQREPWFPEPGR